jgi:DNA-binding NtrC family response regulator
MPDSVAPTLHEEIAASWDMDIAADLATAKRRIKDNPYLLGLIAIERIDDANCAVLHEFLLGHSSLEWVGIFAASCFESKACNELILNHLFDFHTLPVCSDRLLHTLGHAYGRALLWSGSIAVNKCSSDVSIIGDSPAIKKLLREIKKIAHVDAPVMISGPSGSGKELAAQAVHRVSPRAQGPFVAVNCSALPGTLIQSELFGYEKGAFTGAGSTKQGFFESARGGTIFLDEICDLPLDLQTNLLRFLQEKTITRIGSTRDLHIDVRVIAASHANLEKAVADGKFREDLYYRLNVLPLVVPSLTERREDIALLAQHFFSVYAAEKNPRLKGFSTPAISAMETYEWPGNVRELLNRVRRALVMAEGRLISRKDLGLDRRVLPRDEWALHDVRASAERTAIRASLNHAGNNITLAARNLGVSRMTLYRLLEKHDISAC